MKWVLYCNHVYWPSMIKDCIDYAKACRECQLHDSIQQIPASELHSIIKPWPFRGWDLYLIGLIHPPSSRQHKFILVVIDYFTKWVEEIPLIEVNQNEIIDFIKEYIIHRFGIPQTLSTDQGTMITGSTGTSPYKLVYGHDAVLPLEINLNTLRILKQNDLPVDDYWNAMFDELNELDSERILALENIVRQKESIARSYNRRIKEKSFDIGELVFKVILPMEKKSKFLGKRSHAWEGPFQIIGTYSGNAYQIKDIESEKVINPINGKYLKQYYYWQN
ncbi:hypothetical protein AAHE18_13G229600 [Arachis hypogaea]